jgi:hypothetical protein
MSRFRRAAVDLEETLGLRRRPHIGADVGMILVVALVSIRLRAAEPNASVRTLIADAG